MKSPLLKPWTGRKPRQKLKLTTVLDLLSGVLPFPPGDYLRCPATRKNLSVFNRNRIPPLRDLAAHGKPWLIIHKVNARRRAA